jgi:cystathionine beta-lyase/cystathionine gamma-synthase
MMRAVVFAAFFFAEFRSCSALRLAAASTAAVCLAASSGVAAADTAFRHQSITLQPDDMVLTRAANWKAPADFCSARFSRAKTRPHFQCPEHDCP